MFEGLFGQKSTPTTAASIGEFLAIINKAGKKSIRQLDVADSSFGSEVHDVGMAQHGEDGTKYAELIIEKPWVQLSMAKKAGSRSFISIHGRNIVAHIFVDALESDKSFVRLRVDKPRLFRSIPGEENAREIAKWDRMENELPTADEFFFGDGDSYNEFIRTLKRHTADIFD